MSSAFDPIAAGFEPSGYLRFRKNDRHGNLCRVVLMGHDWEGVVTDFKTGTVRMFSFRASTRHRAALGLLSENGFDID
jgi:hypothetical protein